MAAILMTSLLGPDAELRWANWLKLLQIPQSLILYRSPKIVTKFTRDHSFGPFDIDYKTYIPPLKCAATCDFQQCGILTFIDSDEPVQPPVKLRDS